MPEALVARALGVKGTHDAKARATPRSGGGSFASLPHLCAKLEKLGLEGCSRVDDRR